MSDRPLYLHAVTSLARVILLLALAGPAVPGLGAQEAEAEALPTIEAKTEGMIAHDGFVPLYWDETDGKLWLEFSRFGEEFLHYVSLPAGIGSNDIGLDRGQLGPQSIVRLERVGRRVLMVEPNYDYRASTENPLEARSVDEAFATSVLWGFEVAAESGGRVLVDATEFLIRDAHGVANRLRRARQGSFRLEPSRSAFYLERTRGFPANTEIEAVLTFTGDSAGSQLYSVAPTGTAVTVRQHHSFVRLPDLQAEDAYEPRAMDPRAGYFGISYLDYSAPLGQPMRQRFISRHKLRKVDPAAAVSDAIEPIVYYLDPGTPEPVRSALLDGAGWWAQAFEAAGYRDAFRVEMLPADADPMDLRYNVIQWVHRSTRGWSYGGSVSDPRTGEILKGHVSLGSLRVRQDYLIAEALLQPYESGDEVSTAAADMALARIRQLSAHEVGHTLGLAHNYIASAQDRASVMDYPHPFVVLAADGSVDLSDAYAVGIGAWDKVAIDYGYRDFPAGTDEAAALDAIIDEAAAGGLTFLTDQDARPTGGAHPEAHLWDNGKDAAAELDRIMTVRRTVLDRFGERSVRAGMPLAAIEEALVPMYFFHRYQLEAGVKLVGGVEYTYAARGDGQVPQRPVPAGEQRQALQSVLATLDPSALEIPVGVLDILPPRPPGFWSHRELFNRSTGPTFDAVSPAAAAADLTASLLLDPARAQRLIQQNALDEELPGLFEVMDDLIGRAFGGRPVGAYQAEIVRVVQWVVVENLIRLAARAATPAVRSAAEMELETLAEQLADAGAAGDGSMSEAERRTVAHSRYVAREISRFLDRPAPPTTRPDVPDAPPGSPIGASSSSPATY